MKTKWNKYSNLKRQGNSPLEFIVGAGWECGRFENFAHFLTTEAKVVDCPHVAESDDFHLKEKKKGILLANNQSLFLSLLI